MKFILFLAAILPNIKVILWKSGRVDDGVLIIIRAGRFHLKSCMRISMRSEISSVKKKTRALNVESWKSSKRTLYDQQLIVMT